ncbi:MAG: DUF4411 family protein [Candidatus Methanofastidiosa archaeon]|nr:DUF4411 family protein [Candidatus Methanofastidiosa archaeon]
MKYVIDTSSILEGATNRRYELELFPTHWNNLSKIINEKIVVSTPLVLEELGKKDDDMFKWAESRQNMFQPIIENVQIEHANLFTAFPDWAEHNINKKPTWADPELIAYSKAFDLTIVTQEKCNINAQKEENYKIPTICFKYGVKCIDLLELIRREKLHE